MGFEQLLERLRLRVRQKVRNGELTERRFAKEIGLSQSHVHNLLGGRRVLTPATADRFLEGLGLTVVDLLHDEELQRKPPDRLAGYVPQRGFRAA